MRWEKYNVEINITEVFIFLMANIWMGQTSYVQGENELYVFMYLLMMLWWAQSHTFELNEEY
jgi:hypothetical protein